jgi:UDP-glucose 4-epimerase
MTARRPSCIVLGGGGFLGINLCRRLDSAGYRVRAFGRHCLFPEALDHIEWYQGDFTDAAALATAIETNDIVFHLLHGTTPQSANLDMAADLKQNVVSSVGLLDISRSVGVKRVVFVSSGGTIYGPTNEIPTPETTATEPITAYGISKLAIEKYLALYERLYDLEYRILRVANPFGPFQVPVKHQGVIATLISRGLRGESVDIWGDGSVVRDYIYVDDVVAALENVMSDKSNVRVFNIGSGQGRSVLQIIASIEKLLNTRLRINWSVGRQIDVPKSVLSIERAKAVLRWKPETSFEKGLQRTFDWWKSKTEGAGAA